MVKIMVTRMGEAAVVVEAAEVTKVTKVTKVKVTRAATTNDETKRTRLLAPANGDLIPDRRAPPMNSAT